MSKHTPGLWRAGLTENGISTVRSSRGTVCSFDWRDKPRRMADARLIAAAPDLLKVAQLLIDANCPEAVDFAVMRARAAIAKATGEQA